MSYRFSTIGALALLLAAGGCSLFKTRPVQEMSNTAAAMKAAKEVQADVLAPVTYRQANEWWMKAKDEYKLKNFDLAEEYAAKARKLAEQAEYEVLKNPGATREGPPTEPEPQVAPSPYDYPKPTPIPIEEVTPEASPAAPGGAPGTQGGGAPAPVPSIGP